MSLAPLRALEVDISELTLIYDKGNNSKRNQALADALGLPVVGSLVPTHHPKLLALKRSRYRPLEGIEGTLAHRTQLEVYGTKRTVLIAYSESFAQKQARSFAQTLSKARRELAELKGVVGRGRHRMDEAKLTARIDEILAPPRWLKEVVAIEHDLAARRFVFRTDQKLRVHAFYCTLALAIVNLIARELDRAGVAIGPKLALRALSEIHETTLVYPAAGGRQGRPRTRTKLAQIDDLQRQLIDALDLATLAPGV